MRERVGGGEGIMEKNQAKRIHAGGGDRQKVRERKQMLYEGGRDESEKNKLRGTRERETHQHIICSQQM